MASTASLPTVSRHYVPSPPLNGFAGLFWYYSGHDVQYSRERILPMANAALIINLGSASIEAGVSGPRSESMIIGRSEADEFIGVHFNPGGLFPFLDFSLSDLHGQVGVSLADLWGKQSAEELLSRLVAARTIDSKFQILERWLMGLMKRPLKHHPAVAFAMKEFDAPVLCSSTAMADRVGLSQRRFIQLFRDEVGITPKLFCRVQRFHQVIDVIHRSRDVDWVDIALSCGYYDQAHFNHDFREFCGLTPTEYMLLRTEHHNHVQVRD